MLTGSLEFEWLHTWVGNGLALSSLNSSDCRWTAVFTPRNKKQHWSNAYLPLFSWTIVTYKLFSALCSKATVETELSNLIWIQTVVSVKDFVQRSVQKKKKKRWSLELNNHSTWEPSATLHPYFTLRSTTITVISFRLMWMLSHSHKVENWAVCRHTLCY